MKHLVVALTVAAISSAASADLLAPGQITATASSQLLSGTGAVRTIDRSGMHLSSGQDAHNNVYTDMWLSANYNETSNPAMWIMWEFDAVHTLDTMNVWNYNQSGSQARGMRHIVIETSVDGSNWSTFSSDYSLASGNAAASMFVTDVIDFNDTAAKFVRFTSHLPIGPGASSGNWGDTARVGLSEVEFLTVIPEPASMGLLSLGVLMMIQRRRA